MSPSEASSSIRRSSVSFRSKGALGLPQPRSRSVERSVPEPNEKGNDDIPKGKITRCDSDPLDSPTGDDVISSNGKPQPHKRSSHVFPTLPRFPVTETHNRNCWSEPPAGKSFKVRGPKYTKDKKKISSGPYVFTARGADLMLVEDGSAGTSTDVVATGTGLFGHARSVPSFVINFLFPWGVLVHYYELPSTFLPFLRSRYEKKPQSDGGLAPIESFAPHERALIRFFLADDEQRDCMFKMIPVCIEGPWVVRQLVSGKPAIIGKRVPTKYKFHAADHSHGLADCFQVELDVTASSDPVGKKAVSVCRRYMSAVTVDVGIVIEGKEEDELPEQMLGCVRLHRIDSLLAPTLPSV